MRLWAEFQVEITRRTIVAARKFLPALFSALGFGVVEVLISLLRPVSIEIGGYKFPILIPFWEDVTKILCYLVVIIAFGSLFTSFTCRNYVLNIARNRAKSTRAKRAAENSRIPISENNAGARSLSATEVRRQWELIRMERELREIKGCMDPGAEPITDVEAFEILIPLLCAVLLMLLILWPIILIVSFIAALVLGIKGSLNLVLARIVEFILRGAFRL